jgi:GH18 family chitinase
MFVSDVKAIQSRGLKVIVSVGHSNALSPKRYSVMAKNEELRKNFVENVKYLMDKYGFDGFLPNWRYPVFLNVRHHFTSAKNISFENREEPNLFKRK